MITFNFKKESKKQGEKYDYPVLTQMPFLKNSETKQVAKFKLNKAAIAAMGYPADSLKGCKISIGRLENSDTLVIANTTDVETAHQFNVNMNGSFNSAFLLNNLVPENMQEQENEYELTVTQEGGYSFATMNLLLPEEEIGEEVEESIEFPEYPEGLHDMNLADISAEYPETYEDMVDEFSAVDEEVENKFGFEV